MCSSGDQTHCHSRVWLSGALCSPHRLLFASILTGISSVSQFIISVSFRIQCKLPVHLAIMNILKVS